MSGNTTTYQKNKENSKSSSSTTTPIYFENKSLPEKIKWEEYIKKEQRDFSEKIEHFKGLFEKELNNFRNYKLLPEKNRHLKIIISVDRILDKFVLIMVLEIDFKERTINCNCNYTFMNGDPIIAEHPNLKMFITRFFSNLNSIIKYGCFYVHPISRMITFKLNHLLSPLSFESLREPENFKHFFKIIYKNCLQCSLHYVYKILYLINVIPEKVMLSLEENYSDFLNFKKAHLDFHQKINPILLLQKNLEIGNISKKEKNSRAGQHLLGNKQPQVRPAITINEKQGSEETTKTIRNTQIRKDMESTSYSMNPFRLENIPTIYSKENIETLIKNGLVSTIMLDLDPATKETLPKRIRLLDDRNENEQKIIKNLEKPFDNQSKSQILNLNIADYFKIKVNNQDKYFVEHPIVYGTLENLLDLNFNLSLLTVIPICLNVAHGLKSFHELKNDEKKTGVYTFLNPKTILINLNLIAKLNDFSFSCYRASGDSYPIDEKLLDQAWKNYDKYIYYLAPEVLNLEPFDHSADIFSLGCLIGYLIFKEDFYVLNHEVQTDNKEKTPSQKRFNHCLNIYEQHAKGSCPKYIAKILYQMVLWCTKKNPTERIDVNDVIILLKEIKSFLESFNA